jgi:hypothetical protein
MSDWSCAKSSRPIPKFEEVVRNFFVRQPVLWV